MPHCHCCDLFPSFERKEQKRKDRNNGNQTCVAEIERVFSRAYN